MTRQAADITPDLAAHDGQHDRALTVRVEPADRLRVGQAARVEHRLRRQHAQLLADERHRQGQQGVEPEQRARGRKPASARTPARSA